MAKKQLSQVTSGVVRVDNCVPHAQNYKSHPAKQIARIRASLREFGQVQSIVVQAPADPTDPYTLIAGHGLHEAAVAEAFEELRAQIIPADWPPQKVKAYLAADNELARLGETDDEQLLSILEEARNYDEALLQAIGYDDDEFDALLESLAGKEAGKVEPVDTRPPPEMAWVLIGIPLVEYGRIDETVRKLAADPAVICETTVSNVEN